MKNRLFGFVLALVMIISLMPAFTNDVSAALTTDSITQKTQNYIDTLNHAMKSGQKKWYWNANIRKTNSMKNLVEKGDYISCLTTRGCTYSGSHIHANGCTSNVFAADAQCEGFAYYMIYVAMGLYPGNLGDYYDKGTAPTGWKLYKNRDIGSNFKFQPGDYLRIKGSSYGSHSIFVYKVTNDTVFFIDCNWDGHCGLRTASMSASTAVSKARESKAYMYRCLSVEATTPKQKYTLLFDGNGGSGSMSNQVVTMEDKFALPSCTFTREGYRCIGWNVCRNADKTWYLAKHGWLTQQQITEQKLEKKLYANDSSAQYVFDSSWTQGCSTVSTYTFHAVWEQLPHEHNYVRQERPATCTQDGYVKYVCACGSSYNEAVYPALGHDWDNGKVTKEPTATETGIRTYACTRCNETKTESIPVVSVDVTQMFTDVEKNWAYPGIQYCVTHGIMGGMGDGTFAPTGTTTRAQIVQILYNLEGTPAVSGTTPFTDLTANWYKPAILWAYQNNVVAGKSPTTFDPEGPVTREQIAVILTQYMFHVLKMERTWTPADLSTFPDGAQVSSWAKEAMQDAVALGLINGTATSDGTVYLDPQGSATRQQVATILMNFCQNVKK